MNNRHALVLVPITLWASVLGCGSADGGDPSLANKADEAVASSEIGAANLLTGPYLQNLKPDAITVMWETSGDSPDYLEYGTTPGYTARRYARSSASRAGTHIHRVTLTDLWPDTTYHYRVVSTGGTTPDGTFVTAPSTSEDFSFGVWGDSQGTDAVTELMMRRMVEVERVNFAVTVGDLAEDGDDPAMVRSSFLESPVKLLGTRVPFYVAWGNHDGPAGSLIRDFTALPGPSNYSFDYAGCHFVCLDIFADQAVTAEWVRQDLRADAARRAKFIFLFMHAAPWYERWYEGSTWLRTAVVPYMEQASVAIAFSGHMHGYERGYLNGVHYVTTGGGSWLDVGEPLIRDVPHITVGGFSNDPPELQHGLVNEYMTIKVAGNTCTAEMTAFSADGEPLGVLDSFQITR